MKAAELTLKTPITWKGTTYEKLSFRVPTLGDVRALKLIGGKADEDNAEAFEHLMRYAQRLCTTVPAEAFDQITVEDAYQVLPVIAPLFGKPSMGGGH